MNFNSVIEKANIMQAFKKKFKQQENHNNQNNKFINNQFNSQNNHNSRQNQHSVIFHDKNHEKYNQFFNN